MNRHHNGLAAGGLPAARMAVARQAVLAGIMLFMANLRASQRRALLGYVWLVTPAIATAVAFSFLRRWKVFEVGETELPYVLFVLSGILLWQCFFDALIAPITQLKSQSDFLAFVPVRFEAVLVAAFATVALNCTIRIAVLFAALIFWGEAPRVEWLTIMAPAMLMVVVSGAVLSLLVAPLALLVEDIASLLNLVGSFGLFLVPAIYPIPPDSVLALNPLVPMFDTVRAGIIGTSVDLSGLWPMLSLPLLLVVGWWFNVVSRPHIAARNF